MPTSPPAQPSGRRSHQSPVSLAAREAILNAAEDEFAARGFGGARAESIAQRAGVNKALPFYHFGSKAELYEQVVKQALTRLGEMMLAANEAPSPKKRLAVFIHRFFEYLATNPNWMGLIVRELIDEGSRAEEFARNYLKPIVDAGHAQLESEIELGKVAKIEPLQMMISIAAEVLGYFLLLPFIEGVGLKEPLSPSNLDAREQMVVQLLATGFGMSDEQASEAN